MISSSDDDDGEDSLKRDTGKTKKMWTIFIDDLTKEQL
jgi:hypothetical protein